MEPNVRWSGAYKDALPDSHFFYVDRACVRRTDSDGRSHPLSCRHFPYKDQQGNISLSHVRNAISRAPQSHLPAHVQRDVQRKARALLQHQDRMAANTQQRFPGFGAPLEVTIPHMPRYKQISGDMDPGKYGGLVARSDGDNALELFEIQPVREFVGDDEAAEVGFPFWSKEAYYDLDDLRFDREEVQHALQSFGLEEHELEAMTPDQRALAIAEALFRYGDKVEEAASGWSNDVVTEEIEWMRGDVAGADYIADEDDEFRREILGEEDEDEDFEENPRDDGPCVIFCDTAGRGYYTGSVRMVPRYSPQAMDAKVFADKTAAARVITSHGSMGGCHIYLLKPDDPNYPNPVPPRTPFTENGEGGRRSRGITDTMSPEQVSEIISSNLHPVVTALPVPLATGYVSRLGRYPALMFTISLDPKDAWPNRILENSRFSKFMLDYDPRKGKWSLEQISRGETARIRKYSTPSVEKLVGRIQQLPTALDNSLTANPARSAGHKTELFSVQLDPMSMNMLDKAVYETLVISGNDESVGSLSHPPFATMTRDGDELASFLAVEFPPSHQRIRVSASELEFLRNKGRAGVIVVVDNNEAQVVYYDNPTQLNEDWSELETKLGD